MAAVRARWPYLAFALLGCAGKVPDRSSMHASTTATPAAAPTTRLDQSSPPGHDELVQLPVAGFRAAPLIIPVGDAKLPLLVATHGAGGDPAPTCEAWARRARGRALIVCPRGRAVSELEPRGYYYPDHHALEAEVLAASAAVQARYADRLTSAPAIYAGYSQGASMGALFLPPRAAHFSTLVLTEGGYSEWSLAAARVFHEQGGARVLFVCGTKHCSTSAEKARALFIRVGVECRVENVSGGGHSDEGLVGARLDALVDWVFEG